MYPDARGSPTGWSTQTGLTLVFGSRSQLGSPSGVQAFSEAHGGRGTIRTVTDGRALGARIQSLTLGILLKMSCPRRLVPYTTEQYLCEDLHHSGISQTPGQEPGWLDS
jgi:hypothetical protein